MYSDELSPSKHLAKLSSSKFWKFIIVFCSTVCAPHLRNTYETTIFKHFPATVFIVYISCMFVSVPGSRTCHACLFQLCSACLCRETSQTQCWLGGDSCTRQTSAAMSRLLHALMATSASMRYRSTASHQRGRHLNILPSRFSQMLFIIVRLAPCVWVTPDVLYAKAACNGIISGVPL